MAKQLWHVCISWFIICCNVNYAAAFFSETAPSAYCTQQPSSFHHHTASVNITSHRYSYTASSNDYYWHLYDTNAEYRADINQQAHQIVTVFAGCNHPVLATRVRMRLAICEVTIDPPFNYALVRIQKTLIAKYYDDDGALRYSAYDESLGATVYSWCAFECNKQTCITRLALINDDSARMIISHQEAFPLSLAWMGTGMECAIAAMKTYFSTSYSSCTLERARAHSYNKKLIDYLERLDTDDYQQCAELIISGDRLMNDLYQHVCKTHAPPKVSKHAQNQVINTPTQSIVNHHAPVNYIKINMHEALADGFIDQARNKNISYLSDDIMTMRADAARMYQNTSIIVCSKTITITDTGGKLAASYGYDAQNYCSITGNALQHQLLYETGQLLDKAAEHIYQQPEPLTELLVTMVDCAVACNKKGDLKKGYACIDVGWHILSAINKTVQRIVSSAVVQGIAQGVAAGALSAITYIKENPGMFLCSVLFSETMLMYHIASLSLHAGDYIFHTLKNIDYATLTTEKMYAHLQATADACKTKLHTLSNMPLQMVIANTVSCGVDWYIQAKCANGVNKLCAKAMIYADKVAQKIQPILTSDMHKTNGFLEINLKPKKNISYDDKIKAYIDHPVVNSLRVKNALKEDPYHDFISVIDNYSRYAKKFNLSDADIKLGTCLKKDLYQIEGSFNGVDGIFEWIVEYRLNKPLEMSHRRFIKNGIITGIPNVNQKMK